MKTIQISVPINKVLLKHGHTNLLTDSAATFVLQQQSGVIAIDHGPMEPKTLTLFIESVC